MKCPACGFANEDGVLFCEKCKADMEMPAAAPPAQVPTMNEHSVNPSGSKSPLEEPIPLEPIPLEPVTDVTDSGLFEPGLFEPAAVAQEQAPMLLEPAGDSVTVEQAGVSDTTADAGTARVAETPQGPSEGGALTSPKLVVVRGQRVDAQYPLYTGKNYLGRTDDKPVDIDLDDQESPDRIWCSRQHAVITFENGTLTIEDLNSLNGTFVNRTRVHPGQVRDLHENDVIQVGTVHMKVTAG